MKSYIKQSILALAALGLFAACSSDANEPAKPQVIEEGSIDLAIPSHFFATRAMEVDPTDAEATIHKLFVVAYKADATATADQKPIVRDLTNAIGADVSAYNGKYKSVPCRLPAGDYHLYVLANTIGAATDVDQLDEETFRKKQFENMKMLQASELSGADRKYLPMSTYYTDLTSDGTTKFPEGKVTINPASKKTVYADLTIAYAKMRITIYNTKTIGLTLKKGTETNNNGIALNNLSSIEDWFILPQPTKAPAVISGASYPAGQYYKLATTDWTEPTDDAGWQNTNVEKNGGELSGDPISQNWMWQSVVYVPERLYETTTSTKTNISISMNLKDYAPVDLGGNTGLERGKLYDVIAYVDAKKLMIKVRVNAWNWSKYSFNLEDDDSGSVTPAI